MAWVNKPSVFVGDLFENKYGDVAEVLEYINARNIKVKFLGDHEGFACVAANNLRSGAFKNYMRPSVQGVGFLGGDTHDRDKFIRDIWRSCIVRCYSEKYQKKQPTYKGCVVDPEWHNFQNFLVWFKSQRFYDKGYDLDKDILGKTSKIYSKDTCCLVPTEINNFFIVDTNKRSDLPRYITRSEVSYRVRVTVGGKRKCFGFYKSLSEAVKVADSGRKEAANALIIKWRGKVDESVIVALSACVDGLR